MVDYESDEALQEIHDEMYHREQSRPSSGFSKLQPQTKFIIGAVIAVIVILWLTNKIDFKTAAIMVGAGAILMLFMRGSDPSRSELTWVECMIRVNDLLKFLQKHPIGDNAQIPKGEIHIKPIGRKQWYEGQAFKRSYAVDIYDEELDLTEMYFVEVDVYTGDIITFKHTPEGVYGDETRDIKLMPTYDMLIQKKRDQYLSKGIKK